jgi:GNAT superfamily N-acetyltransferase
MARTPKAKAPPEPNTLVRKSAGTYRSGDERFEVRQSGIGWFLVDSTQTDELGQELVQGPYATLAAVRDAIPEARRGTVRALPKPKRPRRSAEDEPQPKAPEPEPEPEPIDPLLAILLEAASDRFPAADLEVEVLPAPAGAADAVVSFTGHSVVAGGVDAAKVRRQLRSDDPGEPMSPTFLAWLGKQLRSEPGTIDAVMVAHPGWVSPKALALEPATGRTVDAHERVKRARAHRDEVEVHTDPDRRGLVIVGRGLAGRLEVSIEVHPEHRGRGLGADLARAALRLAVEGEPLFAQVSPGNVASLRAFLAAGYKPIGSEVLFLRPRRRRG